MVGKQTGIIPILLLFSAMVIGGCGWITGGNDASNAPGAPQPGISGTLDPSDPASFSAAAGTYTINTVTPNQGFLGGGENIFIGGVFPAITNAINIYKIYFGANIAPYVPLVPSFTTFQLNVTAPPGDALGLVDVWLYDTISGMYCATLVDGYEYIPQMELLSINPDNGPECSQTPIEVITRLPSVLADVTDVAIAKSMYEVTIDGFQCIYDISAPEAIRVNGDSTVSLFMLAPVGASLGLKDAELIDKVGAEPNALLTDAFEYTGITFNSITPSIGGLGFNTPVEVNVTLPAGISLLVDNTNLATATALYDVTIDGFSCTYDVSQPNLIETLADNTTTLFMLTPPGASIGFKDVEFVDIAGCHDVTEVDGFEYVNGGSFGAWTESIVSPNPVGPLKVGELQVRIEVTGALDPADFDVFIVPQGGNPINATHRIPLIYDATLLNPNPLIDDPTRVWMGTNTVNIETEMFSSVSGGELYPDGHAAVYIATVADGIVGMDYSAPYSDAGRISGNAILGRHFTIDTLPPYMLVAPATTQTASPTFVNPLNVTFDYTPSNADASLNAHPYPLPAAGFPNVVLDFPFTNQGITDTPGAAPQGAQRFFNVASISNNSTPLTETLSVGVQVEFIDLDIHSRTGNLSPDATYDDYFNGNSYRAPAGFSNVISPIFSPNVAGEESELLGGVSSLNTDNAQLFARWELQGAATPFPSMNDATVQFGPLIVPTPITTGFVYTTVGDNANEDMRVSWILDGIELPEDYMRLVTKFAAADRAGVYFPRGDNSEPVRKVMTLPDDQLDPLQLWWLREVSTIITHDGIPADGVTQSPDFQWEIGTAPRPTLDAGETIAPLHTYALWESPASENLEDFRNGPFSPMTGTYDWSDNGGWLSGSLPANAAFAPAAANLNPNRWYLLTVMSIDEAGNTEFWPAELIHDGTNITVDGSNNKGGNNWRRFYFAKERSRIDTKVSFDFWHDFVATPPVPPGLDVIDNNEAQFGSNTIIPLPSQQLFFPPNALPDEIVKGVFDAQIITDIVVPVGGSSYIEWNLSAAGVQDANFTLTNPGTLLLPNAASAVNQYLGDPERRKPITYNLTAKAIIEDSGGAIIAEDETPVNIRFTVVPDDDISDYLKNRKSEDKQFIKEFNRQ